MDRPFRPGASEHTSRVVELSCVEGRNMEDAQIFYRMQYRLLAQPFTFFENIFSVFGEGDRVVALIAERDGVALSGILLLQLGEYLLQI